MHHRILGLLVYTFLTAFILFSAGQMMRFKYAENPNHLFNYSVPVRLPALSVNSKQVQNILVGDGSLQFSLEAAVNQSLRSESVYNGLSDYIFDKMVEMKGSSGVA